MKTALLLLSLLLAGAARAADSVEIRLATLLPRGTSGFQRLVELRQKWTEDSAGAVKLTVMSAPEGEIQIMKHLESGRFHGALVSAVGLAQLDRSSTCLQLIPLAFRDWREVDYVREQMRGELEARLRAAGYEVLFWADAGWVRFFSRQPAVRPVDLKPLRMFVWTGEPQQIAILRDLKYQPVGLETEFLASSLAAGTVDVAPVPPFLANAGQLFKYAPHMIDLNWAPIIGAAVVKREIWEKVPPAARAKLLRSADEIGARVRANGREEDLGSIAAMQKKKGFTVHTPDPAAAAEWRALVEAIYPKVRGNLVPAELFDRVHAHLADFRTQNSSAK